MKGWVGLVGWPVADGLPTWWSPISCRSSAGQVKLEGVCCLQVPVLNVWSLKACVVSRCRWSRGLTTCRTVSCWIWFRSSRRWRTSTVCTRCWTQHGMPTPSRAHRPTTSTSPPSAWCHRPTMMTAAELTSPCRQSTTLCRRMIDSCHFPCQSHIGATFACTAQSAGWPLVWNTWKCLSGRCPGMGGKLFTACYYTGLLQCLISWRGPFAAITGFFFYTVSQKTTPNSCP